MFWKKKLQILECAICKHGVSHLVQGLCLKCFAKAQKSHNAPDQRKRREDIAVRLLAADISSLEGGIDSIVQPHGFCKDAIELADVFIEVFDKEGE